MSLTTNGAKNRPVIAILTVTDQYRPLRGNLPNYIDLIRTGNELGATIYVTTTSDLKLSRSKIVGHTYDPDKKAWVSRLFPLPNVVYNRIPYRKMEFQPEAQQVIQSCLNHRRIQLFNPSFFNKWTLFEWLSKASATKNLTPKTERLASLSNLDSMFEQYPTLYLKPVKGKAGRGIMRVSLKDNGREQEYWLVYHPNKVRRLEKYDSLQGLWNKLRQEIGSTEYIVQQGIPLTRYNKRPFDLRLLAQKNIHGRWAISGIGARVAGKRSITTHVPRGGSIDDPQKLLSARFGNPRTVKILQQAEKSAITIAKQIEKASGMLMGEMSMDLGIDTNGNLWFFEANSKPMKFDEPHIRKKSLERVIHYSIYLSRKSRRRNAAAKTAGERG
jgi:hypothetical protein